MAISMAGLGSTMAGYQQGQRQIVTDDEVARKTQRDQWQFDQDKRAQEARAREDAVLNGEPGLGSATPKVQTNGARLADSVIGLFGAKSTAENTQSQPTADGLNSIPSYATQTAASQPSTPASPISYSKLMQQRVNDYAAKNPNDIKGITSMQAKVDSFAQGEVAKKQTEFMTYGNEAIRKLVAFNDVSGVQELMTKHWPDGKQYRFQANKDGSYDVAEVGGTRTKHFSNMDELGRTITNVLSPAQYQAAHAEAQKTGLVEGAKLPAKVAEEEAKARAKAEGDIKTAQQTGVVDKNKADATQSRAAAGLSSASAGEKNFDTGQKSALAKVNAQIAAIDEVAEPSRYKELLKQRASLEPRQVNVGGLHTTLGENDSGMKVPIITDPVTGKVYQGGNVIYDRGGDSATHKQTPPPAVRPPKGFNPL